MAVSKHNDVSKNPGDLGHYYGTFWKILCSATFMQSFIAKA